MPAESCGWLIRPRLWACGVGLGSICDNGHNLWTSEQIRASFADFKKGLPPCMCRHTPVVQAVRGEGRHAKVLPSKGGFLLLAQGYPEAAWADMAVWALSASNSNLDSFPCGTPGILTLKSHHKKATCAMLYVVGAGARCGKGIDGRGCTWATQQKCQCMGQPAATFKPAMPSCSCTFTVRKACLWCQRSNLLKDVAMNWWRLLLLHCS